MPDHLRYVDPNRPRSWLSRAFAWFSVTRVGRSLSEHVVWKVDPYLLRATRGRDEVERRRLWALADRVFAPYAIYRRDAAMASRTIPIIQLTRAAP